MIATQFKNLGFSVVSEYASFSRLGRAKGNSKSALFLPPAAAVGSLGDEAMIIGSICHLRSQGFNRFGIVSFDSACQWGYLDGVDEVIKVEKRSDYWSFIEAMKYYSHFYCIGADVMDGFYGDIGVLRLTKLTQLAAKTGAETRILGFSFNQNPTPTAVQALNELPSEVSLCARDPISHQRLTQNIQRPVELVADLAFLLPPASNSGLVAEVLQWVQVQKASDRIVLGVNVNNLFSRFNKNLTVAKLVDVYVKTMTELLNHHPNLSFLMMPHDSRGDESDVSLAANVLEALSKTSNEHTYQVPFPCRADEIKAICAEVDLVVTGRMHLAIACLGQATPVAGITYQGKFEGLFEHFSLNPQEMLITPENALQAGKLAAFMMNVIPQREAIKEQIQAELGKVQALARQNFTDLETKENFPVESIQSLDSGVIS